jgi:hypothetical protein
MPEEGCFIVTMVGPTSHCVMEGRAQHAAEGVCATASDHGQKAPVRTVARKRQHLDITVAKRVESAE